jgi:anaerobic magnesium-protoporphyrin IX monomethyl ester cyclase
MNVLFINPPSLPFEDIAATFSGENMRSQAVCMPLGILYLSSVLKKSGNVGKVGMLDYALALRDVAHYGNVEAFIEQVVLKHVDFTPDILAVSLIFSTSHQFVTICSKILKTIWPSTVLIVGGTHATNCVHHLLSGSHIDYVARGEGEFAFPEFVRQYSSGAGPVHIKGVYSQAQFTDTASLDMCDSVLDLDTLPFPDWDLIDMDIYVAERGRSRSIGLSNGKRLASIMTTRGCPNHCTFCSSHTVHGRKMRFRSNNNVLQEVRSLHERYGVTLFIPEDDLFTANHVRVLGLLSDLKKLNIPDFELQFPNALSVNTLNRAVMDGLIGAGMRIANIAIESGSEYVQKHIIKKNCNLKRARDIVRYLQSRKIIVRCYFILGFPSETKEQMQETIAYAKSMGPDWSVFAIAAPLVGSEMYEQFLQMGCIPVETDMWSKAFFQARMFDTPEITAADLEELLYRANLECNFTHNPNKVQGKYEVAIEIFNNIIADYPFHIIAHYCLWECYIQLGNEVEAAAASRAIDYLLKTDKRALDMFAKYQDLMPDYRSSSERPGN